MWCVPASYHLADFAAMISLYPNSCGDLNTSQISFFLDDFPNALATATALDEKIQNDAKAYSTQYYDLLSLSLRQAFGAADITIDKDADGKWNTSVPLMFVKNIGDVGAAGSVLTGITYISALI